MLDFNNPISEMIGPDGLRIVIRELESVRSIQGDVVELGCNIGTTSVFIQDHLKGSKEFHVYDSFNGLPEKHENDNSPTDKQFQEGDCMTTLSWFLNTFIVAGVDIPEIHIGWFKDLPMPQKISFAFFDGDFYTSILDSWQKVYPNLVPGAVVCVHDYGYDALPGVKLACDEFLADKPEKIICEKYIGIMRKV